MQIGNFYLSKTIVFFVLAIVVAVASQFGFSDYELDPELSILITSLVGIALRFVTKRPLITPDEE